MITFDKLNRRTHLYLGLLLMPWLMMYGISSFIVIHQSWFGADQAPTRELLFERAYHRPVNLRGANNSPELRAAAQEILKDCNLEGAFWVDKPNADTLHIDRFSFRDGISLTYSTKDQKLTAKQQRMKLPQVAMRMHFRGGYGQPTFGNKLWGLLVDVACVGIVIWVASGLIMWWRLPRLRAWGALAAGGGLLSFLLLVWLL
jgi:hypothetical protein